MFRCFADWAQVYGPIILVWTGSTLNVVISSSELDKGAMRLHPPGSLMLPHQASSNVKISGYDIPKGSNVHVNV
ncbi:hypothetical protein RHGRI_009937 [Rhododendron griersonianum]|uniref:Uncharacterized protein n=1 Tax=Rhododendron griersonianum TaxID=479676 RepID=A0AAV6KHC4_9ERIC|nr:hypothetical protein RHGRI_009937 [Rhododendron griersonianum]